MTKQVNKIKGSLSKDLSEVIIRIPIKNTEYENLSTSKGGYGSINNLYFEYEVEYKGVTIPVDGKIGMYIAPGNWKSVKEQLAGKKEGNKAGTNASELDALMAMVQAQQAQIEALTKALTKK